MLEKHSDILDRTRSTLCVERIIMEQRLVVTAWTKVSFELPAENKYVLTYSFDYGHEIGRMEKQEDGSCVWFDDEYRELKPTIWMELPDTMGEW